MEYVKRYRAKLNFNHRLTKIDGPAKKAWFRCHVASKFTNFGEMAKPRQAQWQQRIEMGNKTRQHPRLGWPLTCRILGIHRFKH
jgi:hypothetical protein